ncbi:Chlorophyll(Ide) b reductase NYC1, chloroplastic [Balamuthia mandrillaris]
MEEAGEVCCACAWRWVVLTVGVAAVLWMLWKRLVVGGEVLRDAAKARRRGLHVVITGSTKGIGLALASEFLRHGDSVVVSSRSEEHVSKAVSQLQQQLSSSSSGQMVVGYPCDVTVGEQVNGLAAFAKKQLGSIDIWINNAGVSQEEKCELWKTPEEVLRSVVNTNLLGCLLGCKAAIRLMLKQPNGGDVFNMDGAGANGMTTANFAVYGATKHALPQLMKTLRAETKGTKVGVHTVSPGMVITDLLLSGNRNRRALSIFNILAERPETVARWMVPRIRGVRGSGRYIRFLTLDGVLWRFLTAWKRRNRFFDLSSSSSSE